MQWNSLQVALVTSVITSVFPSVFEIIGMMEKYHPRLTLRWQLARILVLYLLNLYTLVVALYWKIRERVSVSTRSSSRSTGRFSSG